MVDWNAAIFYYFFGVFTIVFILTLKNRKKIKKSLHKDIVSADSANVHFYLNMYFMDRKEIVLNIVRSKISKNMKLMRGYTVLCFVTLF